MAKKEREASGEDFEVDMTPMIDVVFQLLAFFMVITNFEQTQADERVKLPRDQLAKPPKVKVEHQLVLNVGFMRNLQGDKTDPEPYLFNLGNTDRQRPLDAKKQLNIESRLYEGKGVEPGDVVVKIRADSEVPTGVVGDVGATDHLAGAGVVGVVLQGQQLAGVGVDQQLPVAGRIVREVGAQRPGQAVVEAAADR